MKRQLALFLTLGMMCGSILGCQAENDPEALQEAFTQALFEDNFEDLQQTYMRMQVEAPDEAGIYHALIRQRLDQVEERYLSDIMTYDQAMVQVDQLLFTDELKQQLGRYQADKITRINAERETQDRLRLASELDDRGAFLEALDLYQNILDQAPDSAEAQRGFRQVTHGYVNLIQQDVARLRGERLIQQALVVVQSALTRLPEHLDLLNLQSTLENDLANSQITLDTRTALLDIQELMNEGAFDEAIVLIEQTKQNPDYADRIDELDQMLVEASQNQSSDFLAQASTMAPGQNLADIHWEVQPYAAAAQFLHDQLGLNPDNTNMEMMRNYYSSMTPANLSEYFVVNRGQRSDNWAGNDYFGYTYDPQLGYFNTPMLMVGAFNLHLQNTGSEYTAGPWNRMRIVFSPAEMVGSRSYDDYELIISANGEEVARFDGSYDSLTEPLVYDLNIGNITTVDLELFRDTFFGRLGSGGNEPFYLEAYAWREVEAPDIADE